MKVLLNLTQQDASSPENNDEEYDSELTKMAESATEKGVNEISAGDKNLDSEFKETTGAKKPSGANTNANTKRNKNKKKRKQQRQNKKRR